LKKKKKSLVILYPEKTTISILVTPGIQIGSHALIQGLATFLMVAWSQILQDMAGHTNFILMFNH